jgi:hypothetical protein
MKAPVVTEYDGPKVMKYRDMRSLTRVGMLRGKDGMGIRGKPRSKPPQPRRTFFEACNVKRPPHSRYGYPPGAWLASIRSSKGRFYMEGGVAAAN